MTAWKPRDFHVNSATLAVNQSKNRDLTLVPGELVFDCNHGNLPLLQVMSFQGGVGEELKKLVETQSPIFFPDRCFSQLVAIFKLKPVWCDANAHTIGFLSRIPAPAPINFRFETSFAERSQIFFHGTRELGQNNQNAQTGGLVDALINTDKRSCFVFQWSTRGCACQLSLERRVPTTSTLLIFKCVDWQLTFFARVPDMLRSL